MEILESLRAGSIHPLLFINSVIFLIFFIVKIYLDAKIYNKFKFSSILMFIPVINLAILITTIFRYRRLNRE